MQERRARGVRLDNREGEIGDRGEETELKHELAKAVGSFERAPVRDLLVAIARGADIAGIDVMLLHRRRFPYHGHIARVFETETRARCP